LVVLGLACGPSPGQTAGGAGTGGGAGIAGGAGAGGGMTGRAGTTGAAGTSNTAGAGGTAVVIPPGPGVTMRGNDLKRTGANLYETKLSPAGVTPTRFGKLSCHLVDGQIYGQILYLPGFDFGARGKHNALVVVTMKNHVYLLDADDPTKKYWDKAFGAPQATENLATENNVRTCAPYKDISSWTGILSTPAVDVSAGIIYFVARSLEAGMPVQKLYSLNLADGSSRAGSPVTIGATSAGKGDQMSFLKDPVTGGSFPMNVGRANQRAALTLYGNVVYVAFASYCDLGAFHGWMLGYDANTLEQVVVFNTTPDGKEGGIWMSGSGPAVDDDGSFYLATGNGTADLMGGTNHGESLLRLQRDGATMKVVDWFVPYEYDFLEYEDRDLGSAGVLLVPGTNLVLAGGKDAKIYVANKTNLGKFTPPTTPFQAPGPNQPEVIPVGTDAVVQTLAVASMSMPPRAHNHSTPLYWKSDAGEFIYTMAEEDFLIQWKLVGGKLEMYKASQVKAPHDPAAANDYTMPGGTMSLSADGTKTDSGIVWVTMPVSKDANNATVPGVMYAFAAADVTKTLWSSQMNVARDDLGNYAKFNPVTVYGGKVYVPTFTDPNDQNQFCVYGLR
jgi:hypothetical protein